LPLLPLDRIWFSGPLELATIATLQEASRASDHLPLLASLSWPQPAPAAVGTGFASSMPENFNAGRPNG
jgi:hypothetical protein